MMVLHVLCVKYQDEMQARLLAEAAENVAMPTMDIAFSEPDVDGHYVIGDVSSPLSDITSNSSPPLSATAFRNGSASPSHVAVAGVSGGKAVPVPCVMEGEDSAMLSESGGPADGSAAKDDTPYSSMFSKRSGVTPLKEIRGKKSSSSSSVQEERRKDKNCCSIV
jgi:hypothetical protein